MFVLILFPSISFPPALGQASNAFTKGKAWDYQAPGSFVCGAARRHRREGSAGGTDSVWGKDEQVQQQTAERHEACSCVIRPCNPYVLLAL